MLLINKNLLRLSKGLRGWIVLIAVLRLIVLVGIASFTQTIAGFLSMLYTGAAQGSIWQAAASALAASLVILAGNLLVGEAEYRCTTKSRMLLRAHLYEKLIQLDISNIDQVGTANATTAVVDGVEAMQVYYSKYLPGLLYYFTAPFYIFFKIHRFSPRVSIFLLIVCLLILPINNLFRTIIERLKSGYWKSLRELTAHYLESLQGLSTLKLFNQDEARTAALKKRADNFNKTIMHVMRVNFLATMTTNALMYLSIFCAIVMLCSQYVGNGLEMRQALTVLMLSYSFYSSVRMLMDATHRALNGIAAAQSIEDILELDIEKKLLPGRDPVSGAPGLTMEHVTFAYPGRPAALRDVDLFVPQGQVVALVGQSGCGKSTILSHFLRFRDPDSGRVLLNGTDIRCIPPAELRKQIVLVAQSITIFSGTVEENLRMAKPDASQGELLHALQLVRLADWIQAQPKGLQTEVGDAGAALSGGQRQKIGIARALLSQAPYILFDEATSSVDPESEAEIWSCIHDLAKTRTLVIVSHRLSTVRWANQIYVMEHGCLVEAGTHDTLLQSGGVYAALSRQQQALEAAGKGHIHGQ